MKFIAVFVTAAIVLFGSSNAIADAQVQEWIGHYAMNHDGFVGTLAIEDTKADCATSKWCSLVLKYTNDKGALHTGKIVTIDQRFQHMQFIINFPNNSQKFDAYIFSWDKAKFAGTTRWNNRTFGFYGVKK